MPETKHDEGQRPNDYVETQRTDISAPAPQSRDAPNLIETVREALYAMKAEWSILPMSATFRSENITKWLIRFVGPNMKRIEESLESISKLESALGEKTVPLAKFRAWVEAEAEDDYPEGTRAASFTCILKHLNEDEV